MSNEYDNSTPDTASAFGVGLIEVQIPGPPGPTGPAPNLTIGTVTQGPASATITGTSPNYVLNLVLPPGPRGAQGNPGDGINLTVGSVTSGTTASATITGTSPNLVLNLVLPAGPQGAQGFPGTSSRILLGSGAPSNATGNDTDIYINITTGDLYGPKTAGNWGPIVGNFKGIPDAPADGKMYARKDNAWVEIPTA